jgi:nitroreductase
MTTTSTQAISEALHWRYATKRFDRTRKIPAATWACLEEALVLAPSSFGMQPWRFVVVTDPAMRERLSAAANGQTQPVECSHFVVFAARKGLDGADIERHLARIAEVRAVPAASLKGFGDVLSGFTEHARRQGTLDGWCARQAYIALGQFMAAAALLGVDACPMEGIDPAKFDEILGLPAKGYGAVCACAAGYRATDDKYAQLPKVRFRAQDVILRA